MSTPAAVQCAGLRHRFGPVQALDGVGFEVGAGEVFGLLGPNGAGKTTTIRILATLLHPDEGTARVFGLNVRKCAMDLRRAIGYVPQQLSADAQLTGRENVWLFARLFDGPRAQLYPVDLMPGWLQALSVCNPLSYEVDALRSLILASQGTLWSTAPCLGRPWWPASWRHPLSSIASPASPRPSGPRLIGLTPG